MFGNYLKHVLVLTLLAGIAYSLPQVRDILANSLDFYVSNDAIAINSTSSKFFPPNIVLNKENMPRQDMINVNTQNIMIPAPQGRAIAPEEVVKILIKAGIIPENKLNQSLLVLKEFALKNNRYLPPMMASSTTPTNRPTVFSSTTPPIIKRSKDIPLDDRFPTPIPPKEQPVQ